MDLEAVQRRPRKHQAGGRAVVGAAIDGVAHEALQDEWLVDLINQVRSEAPHVCYHPQLAPIDEVSGWT